MALIQISVALQERKSSFLRDKEWMTLPWNNVAKTPRDQILDILAEVPTAFEAADIYNAMVARESIAVEVKRQELMRFCLDLRQKLAQWHTDHPALVQSASQVAPLRDMNLPSPFHNQTAIAMLHVMTIYWGTSTLVESILRAVFKSDKSRPRDLNPEAPCGKIIVALSNLLHPSIGLYRIHLVTVPLSIAMIQLQDPSTQLGMLCEERRLLAYCLSHPEGSSISKFLNKLADSLHFKREITGEGDSS